MKVKKPMPKSYKKMLGPGVISAEYYEEEIKENPHKGKAEEYLTKKLIKTTKLKDKEGISDEYRNELEDLFKKTKKKLKKLHEPDVNLP